MSNKAVAAKLFIYGKEKDDVLVPICGFGDYLYYAMWISGIHALSTSVYAYMIAAFMLFVGTGVQSIIVKTLSRKPGLKGFPGTVFPFFCILVEYFGLYYFG